MNARKRARRRQERDLPTYVLQEEYRPDFPDPIVFRIRALDGLGREAIIGITWEQARKFGFSTGLVQPEVAAVQKRLRGR
jgi:hypothetical protein